jgi:drug/metabolite transporter (DMT)-like permease
MNKYIFMVFAGACSFGILSTFVKLAYREGYTAAEISFSQAFIGMVILWIWVFVQRKTMAERNINPIPLTRWWALLLTGSSIGLTTFVYYVSVHYIPASIAIVILMQFSWISMLLDWFFFKKRPTVSQLLVVGMILVGTVMASGWFGVHTGEISLTGVLYAFGSACLYAVYLVANSRVGNEVPALKKSAVMMMGATLAIFLVNAVALTGSTHFDLHLIKWALFLAVFGTVIPPILFAKGMPRTGVGLSAILMTVELPVATICSYVILQEPIAGLQWLGVTVMLLSMILLNVQKIKYLNQG